MREKYYTPTLDIEILDKADVLLNSFTVDPTPAQPLRKREKENAYGSFKDFIFSGEAFFD